MDIEEEIAGTSDVDSDVGERLAIDVPRSFSRSSHFMVTIAGQIETGFIESFENVYVKFCFAYGADWQVIGGAEDGITQVAKIAQDEQHLFVWNFPIDISFKSRYNLVEFS